jgi:hypothetical protein
MPRVQGETEPSSGSETHHFTDVLQRDLADCAFRIEWGSWAVSGDPTEAVHRKFDCGEVPVVEMFCDDDVAGVCIFDCARAVLYSCEARSPTVKEEQLRMFGNIKLRSSTLRWEDNTKRDLEEVA